MREPGGTLRPEGQKFEAREPMKISHNNNNNNRISIAPYGRNLRGAGSASKVRNVGVNPS